MISELSCRTFTNLWFYTALKWSSCHWSSSAAVFVCSSTKTDASHQVTKFSLRWYHLSKLHLGAILLFFCQGQFQHLRYNPFQGFVHICIGFVGSYFGYTYIMTHTACAFGTGLFFHLVAWTELLQPLYFHVSGSWSSFCMFLVFIHWTILKISISKEQPPPTPIIVKYGWGVYISYILIFDWCV